MERGEETTRGSVVAVIVVLRLALSDVLEPSFGESLRTKENQVSNHWMPFLIMGSITVLRSLVLHAVWLIVSCSC